MCVSIDLPKEILLAAFMIAEIRPYNKMQYKRGKAYRDTTGTSYGFPGLLPCVCMVQKTKPRIVLGRKVEEGQRHERALLSESEAYTMVCNNSDKKLARCLYCSSILLF